MDSATSARPAMISTMNRNAKQSRLVSVCTAQKMRSTTLWIGPERLSRSKLSGARAPADQDRAGDHQADRPEADPVGEMPAMPPEMEGEGKHEQEIGGHVDGAVQRLAEVGRAEGRPRDLAVDPVDDRGGLKQKPAEHEAGLAAGEHAPEHDQSEEGRGDGRVDRPDAGNGEHGPGNALR